MINETKKPSLQDIADSPLTVGREMMRQHYDPMWKMHDDSIFVGKGQKAYKVEVSWSAVRAIEGTEIFVVAAENEVEAKGLAEEMTEDEAYLQYGDVEDFEATTHVFDAI
jgi:hypothetical protein